MGESFQDYSWIQDYEADFLQIIMASLIYFQFILLGQLTILLEIINDM